MPIILGFLAGVGRGRGPHHSAKISISLFVALEGVFRL